MILAEYIDRVGLKLQKTADSDKHTLKHYINRAIEDIFREFPYMLYKEDYLQTVADYATGTVTATNGAASVAGSGTVFTSAMVGRKIRIDDNSRYYKIGAYVAGSQVTLDEDYEESTVSGVDFRIYQDEYDLPSDFKAMISLAHAGIQLVQMDEWTFSNKAPSVETTTPDEPLLYRVIGTKADVYTPSTACTLKVVSTYASDTQTVTVYGTVGGYDDSEAIVLTGTVSVASTKTFSEVFYAKISDTVTGRVDLKESGDTLIGSCSPGDRVIDVLGKERVLRVYPIPADVYPLYVKYYANIPELENYSDYVVNLPKEFDTMIIDRAYIEGLYEEEDDRAVLMEQRWTAQLQKIKREEARLRNWARQPKFTFDIRQSVYEAPLVKKWYDED